MKVLVASTPATGHLNPLLAIGHFLVADGHEVAGLTGTALRDRIEGAGLNFYPLPAGADFDLRDLNSVVPELKDIPPGLERSRRGIERVFVDTIPAQHEGLQRSLEEFAADVIVADDMYFGILPMLLRSRPRRPAVVLCGTSFLHWPRDDGASHFAGMPPATTQAQRDEYAAVAREHDRLLHQPLIHRLNRHLKDIGVETVSRPLFESALGLADSFIQLTVPDFEYPRKNLVPSVHFVGTPPILPNQVPLPSWAHELDGSRKVVLVTQGTVANHDFNLLIGPTLAALANERDLLVIATAGGRPTEAIPGPIPANARLAKYLPFEWALAKADVFVTNGGYGSVNQAMSFGLPIVTAGLTQDKAEVNARIAWSGVGINLATNKPAPEAVREAVRAALDKPDYRACASLMAAEYAAIDTRSEILRIISEAVPTQERAGIRQGRSAA
jgi:UDP:flavonoid glycosyltransferase YjiC (YdhE family)